MISVRDSLEAAGVEILEHSEPTEILPAIWVTGPSSRLSAAHFAETAELVVVHARRLSARFGFDADMIGDHRQQQNAEAQT